MGTISYASLTSQSETISREAANNQDTPSMDLAFLLEIDLRLGRKKQFLKHLQDALGFLETTQQEIAQTSGSPKDVRAQTHRQS